MKLSQIKKHYKRKFKNYKLSYKTNNIIFINTPIKQSKTKTKNDFFRKEVLLCTSAFAFLI